MVGLSTRCKPGTTAGSTEGTALAEVRDSPGEILDELNAQHVVVNYAGKTVVIGDHRDESLKHGTIEISCFSSFRRRYQCRSL